jgi:hypothetical protein
VTYQKTTLALANPEQAIALALAQFSVVDASLAQELQAAGATVLLDDGTRVWASCVVHDRPETPQIDFLTAAIACNADGTPWLKANGQMVCSVFWSAVSPDRLAELSIGVVRKALLMVVLGEPQPQVPIPVPAEGGPTEQDALPGVHADSHSIRTAITAANELTAPLVDVL